MKNYIFLLIALAVGFQSCTDEPGMTDDCAVQTIEIATLGGFTADLESTDSENFAGTIANDTQSEYVSIQLPIMDPSNQSTSFKVVEFENNELIEISDATQNDVVYLHDFNSSSDVATFLVSYELEDKPFVLNLYTCDLVEMSFTDALALLQNQDINQVGNRDMSWIILGSYAYSSLQGIKYGIGDTWRDWWD